MIRPSPKVLTRAPAALVAAACLLAGCTSEQELHRRTLGSVAITLGDFDDVAQPFNRMLVAHEAYEGLIATATWDTRLDPDNVSLKVEALFADIQELRTHDTIVVASGTRGFGARQYNGVDPDDHLISDPAVIENARQFVARGGTLVVTDWAYELVEAAWPDAVTFLGDGSLDAAQRGNPGTVVADVVHPLLQEDLDADVVALDFDFSNWAVMTGVGSDVDVWLRGDITTRNTDGSGATPHDDVPLLVSFRPDDSGTVVFSSFHLDAQTPAMLDQLLATVVGEFRPSDSQSSATIE